MRVPHDGVWARLGRSPIHGIGAFAIRSVPQGTDVFANDQRDIVWVDANVVDALPADAPERHFYEDFGIRRGRLVGCPTSFDLLTVGWYCNEPRPGEQANLRATAGYAMIAARDISAGEELTVRYATFSQESERPAY